MSEPASDPMRDAAPEMYAAFRAFMTCDGQKIHGRPTPAQWLAMAKALAHAEGRLHSSEVR